MRTLEARRVVKAERRGSSLPVVIDTDDGLWFTKLRGAAQGPAALVAEIVVGELADALGLRVPARALIELSPAVAAGERDDELHALLLASAGLNLGFRFIAGARDWHPGDSRLVTPATASTIVWLDGLVQNPDRTPRNPNLMVSNGQVWLIDHGAALAFQHNWPAMTEDLARRAGNPRAGHVLAERAVEVIAIDAELAHKVSRDVLERALAAVPGDFLAPLVSAMRGGDAIARRRAAYVAVLWKRLQPPRPFIGEDPGPAVAV